MMAMMMMIITRVMKKFPKYFKFEIFYMCKNDKKTVEI